MVEKTFSEKFKPLNKCDHVIFVYTCFFPGKEKKNIGSQNVNAIVLHFTL